MATIYDAEQFLRDQERYEKMQQTTDTPPAPKDEIVIANKTVELPPGVYVRGVIISVATGVSPDGECSGCDVLDDLPILIIEKDDCRIKIGKHTGRVVSGHVTPGKEDAFDFLKEAFPDQAQAIESLPMKSAGK